MVNRNLLTASPGFNRCVLGREGYVVYNANDIYVGQAIERYGEFSELEAVLLRTLCQPGAVVVEVGANIGTHTLVLSKSVGPRGFVYAYEPQRIVFQTLCANLAINSVTNVDARNAAAADKPGFVLMPDIDYTKPGNFGGVQPSSFSAGRRIRKVLLDDELQSLKRIDLIKIDVEGAELQVLEGARQSIQRCRPVMYVENDRIEDSERLIRHLMGLDYRLYWHLPPLFNPKNFFADDSNVFPNIASANMLCIPRRRPQDVRLKEVVDPLEHPFRRAEAG